MIPISEGYVTAVWSPRKEVVDACAERFALSLRQLETIDTRFSKWLHVRRRGRVEVKPECALLKGLLLAGRNRTDFPPRRVIEELGFYASLMTDSKEDKERMGLSLNCGNYSSRVLSHCSIEFAPSGSLSYHSVPLSVQIEVLKSLVQAWHPDWGAICSRTLRESMKKEYGINLGRSYGWITYVSQSRGEIPDQVSQRYYVEDMPQYGRLIYVTRESFDEKNPEQVEAAVDLYRLLDGHRIFYKFSTR